MAPRKKRRARRGGGKSYFTKIHENAIVKYANSDDLQEREFLYVNYIGPVFDEMVDKIVYTYKFTNLPNIDDLKSECKIWLTTILNKFDPAKGSKAFSYFSVITKNWFIHKVKHNASRASKEVNFDDGNVSKEMSKLVSYNTYVEDREKKEFWTVLNKHLETWKEESNKPNEKRVAEAIKIILSEPDAIEIFNKKAIYLYLREITGLNTKQIVNSLNKIRSKYKIFKTDWDA
jgi:DNA-directed RNA polymerase specialized sigma subunit